MYLLDTNVVAELRKAKAGKAWGAIQNPANLAHQNQATRKGALQNQATVNRVPEESGQLMFLN